MPMPRHQIDNTFVNFEIDMRGQPLIGAILALSAVLAVSPAVVADDEVSAQSFVLVGVNVVPMDEERVLADPTVVVIDGFVSVIGARDQTAVPAGIPRIRGDGRFLLPGFADLHVHVTHEDDLLNYLSWGVTTIMHLGGFGLSGPVLLEHKKAIAAGRMLGPAIYTTDQTLDGDPPVGNNSVVLATADEARAEVRRLKTDGFDLIKAYQNLSRPVFVALVAEAQIQGLAIVGHLPRRFDAIDAITGGQNAIAHTEELFFTHFDGPRSTVDMPHDYRVDLSRIPALIEAMLENDVAIMPDLSFTFTDQLMWDDLDLLWNDPEFSYLHPATAAMWRSGNINRREAIENFVLREEWKYDLMQELTLRFQKAGILQVVGTDSAVPGLFPGKALHRELTEFIKAGLSNFEAMKIATANGGEFIRNYIDTETRIGLVKPGYKANLVVLAENPLEDVRNARTVESVIVNGRWTDAAQLASHRAQLLTKNEAIIRDQSRIDLALEQESAASIVLSIRDEYADDPAVLSMIENQLNVAGYSAILESDLVRAREIFRLNTVIFPDSPNTWDSYAESFLNADDYANAEKFYRRALQADPEFANATRMLNRIAEATTATESN
jgi:tetratricopeptide (TPR) repeat protein